MMANRSGITLTVQFNHLPQLRKEMRQRANIGLDRGFATIQVAAKAGAPVGETGGLRASVYRVTPLHNDYATAVARMLRLNPNAIPVEPPRLDLTGAYIGLAADYGYWVHNGTHRMPARPFVMEALIRNQDNIQVEVIRAIEGAARGEGLPRGGQEVA